MKLALTLYKSPKKFGTDEMLSHSDIHLIEIIGEHSGLSVTDTGKLLGITKGAVSQGLKKLENRGYTRKETDPENLSRSMLHLTEKGQEAFLSHRKWHKEMDGGFSKYLNELGKEEQRVIKQFLEKTEDFLKRRIESEE